MRVVIDCNVLVSAARSGGTCAKVIIEAVRDHEVVLSGPIAERSAHASYRDGLLAILEELERVATVVKPADAAFGLRDPDDEIYLATAAADGAVLITGNSQDFTESQYGSVVILSPRTFLDRVTRTIGNRHPSPRGRQSVSDRRQALRLTLNRPATSVNACVHRRQLRSAQASTACAFVSCATAFSSRAPALDESLPMIGKPLGHIQVRTTACYAHLINDPVKAAANRIVSRIADAAGRAG